MPQGFFTISHNRTLGTLVLIAALVALGAYSILTLTQAKQWNSGPVVISVTGTGEVSVKPDVAQFSFSVRGEGVDAATAQAGSAKAITAIVEYLTSQGVEEKDIKTENYYLAPKFTYEQTLCVYGAYCPPGEPVANGFEVSETIMVKVRAIDTAGTLLSQIGTLGATDVSGLSFTIDDTDELKAQARDLAIEDAKAQAEKLASSLGVRIVKMTGYYEEMGDAGYPYSPMPMMADRMMSAEKAETPAIATGENKTTSRITLSYEVK